MSGKLKAIYLDYHAHAPIDPRVLAALVHGYELADANPHSSHMAGEAAGRVVESARAQVAQLLGASAGEIIFTSGATEANNLALSGLYERMLELGRFRILISAGEHPSVIAAARSVAREHVTVVPLLRDGRVDLNFLAAALGPEVGLVSIAAANHEIGTIQDISGISDLVRQSGALFHSDLAQAAPWLKLDSSKFDLASVSAHKMGGPIGIGALFVARRHRRHITALIQGGGQEAGARAGTLSPQLCSAFGEASRIIQDEREINHAAAALLRDRLWTRLQAAGAAILHGSPERLPGNLNLSFEGVDGEALVLRLRDTVSLSTGSACTAHSLEPSHVLLAIGLNETLASGAVRFGLGPQTSETDIDAAADAVLSAVSALRAIKRRAA